MSKHRPPEATAVRKRIRLFLAAHVAAPVVIYGLAIGAGGGLASTPIPQEPPIAARTAMTGVTAWTDSSAAPAAAGPERHDIDGIPFGMPSTRRADDAPLHTRREAPPRWLRDTDRRPAYLGR